ncbi:PIR Superfamily Protein [Plasmodium ovale wallikeri]|uniref:PIR Superfamily Protein n=1 Tax=Plasmodium ovale wallikeri TaxID=864142 RepID=A0A1A8ZKQ7_PLAOA|nr:PIR Superfamily Protein [Plasmodium ovale wallikeri]SBT44472.1 PIR Superfamily Protein [Plasmodium ovale wallikeri]
MSYEIPDIYSFFSDFKTYMQYDNYIEKNSGKDEHNNTCHAFISDVNISSSETANNICAKFKNLYKFIHTTKESKRSEYLDDNDFAYLNYWLNNKLRNNTLRHNVTVNVFHKKMNSTEEEFTSYDIFEKKLFDFEDIDFTNMNLLTNLYIENSKFYENINSRKEEEKISCLEYNKELINTYKKGIIQCHLYDTNFCKALKHFEGEYVKISGPNSISEKCTDRKFLKLPTYEDVSQGDKKFTVVGSVLGPSVATLFTSIFLYMFTPFGQWIRGKMGKKKEAHSKLYEENDQSLLNTSDNEYSNTDYNEYHLSYDTLANY